MERKLLRPPEVQREFGLSVSRLAKLRLYGGGPKFIKVGRSVLYDTNDLDAWFQSLKRASTSEYLGDAA